MRVLVIDDDRALASLAQRALREDGAHVDLAFTGDDGVRLAGAAAYDAIVVDLGLPDRTGLSIVEHVRGGGSATPILVFTGHDADAEVVRALDAGADDYLIKPVGNEVLRARVRAAVRRSATRRDDLLRMGELELDRLERRVRVRGEELAVTPKEFTFLELLMLRRNEAVTRPELLERVWGMRFDPGTNVVDVLVARVRQKLRPRLTTPRLRCVRGVGFTLAD